MNRASRWVGGKVSAKAVASFLLVALAFLYLNLFILPCVPIFLVEDPQVYLVNAMRMLEGQVIYRDFFQFTPPGTELVYVALFKWVGPRSWVPSAVLIFLGLSLAWCSVEISKRVARGWAALLPALLFLTMAFRIWFIGSTHNWFSTLAVLLGVMLIFETRTPGRLVGAGMLCGLASFCTQTRGAAAVFGFAVFLLWEGARKGQRWRELVQGEVCLLVSFLLTIVAANAYFIQQAGLKRFLDCTLIFVIRYFPADTLYNSFNAYTADLAELLFLESGSPERLAALGIWLLVHALFPFVYVAFFLRYRREARTHPEERWDQLMLLNLTGLFLLVAIAPAPSWFRLCSVSPPALILLAWLVRSPRKIGQVLVRSLWVLGLIFMVAEPVETQINGRAYLELPVGRTAFADRDLRDKFQWLLHRTRPSEFFFRAIYPDYYFPLGLRNPAEAPYLTPTDYTRPEQVQNVLEALEKYGVRFVLWSVWLDVPGDYHPQGDHLGPLRAYLRSHYHVVKIFSDADFEQVWERNP